MASKLAILAGALLIGTVAQAHPRLTNSNPSAMDVTKAPKSVRLTFSEPLIVQFSGLQMKDHFGRLVQTGKPTLVSNGKQMVVPVSSTLSPGTYRIDWHATSVDTHRVQGHYVFKVSR